jgi:hypothetical protein
MAKGSSIDNKPESYSAIIWRKSRRSADQGNCVEVAAQRTSVLIRDSHDRSGFTIKVSTVQWQELLERLRSKDLDRN